MAVMSGNEECEPEKLILHLRNEFPEEMKDLSDQIRNYYDRNILDQSTAKTKDEIRNQLESVLKQEIGDTVSLVGIGGIINGLGTKDSDMDLSLILPPAFYGLTTTWQYSVDTLRRAQKALRNQDLLKRSDVRTGVIPILRLGIGDAEVDINCNDLSSVYDSHLLRYYCKFDWKFPALALVVKKWGQIEGINDAKIGFLNNYTLVLMVLHYLQAGCDKPVLPNLQKVLPEFFSKENDPACLEYDNDAVFEGMRSENSNSVAELLAGFFGYFANFSFHDEWISIKEGGRKPRNDLDESSERFLIYIEDPFEEKNTTRCVLDRKNLQIIVDAFRRACEKLRQGPCLENLGILCL